MRFQNSTTVNFHRGFIIFEKIRLNYYFKILLSPDIKLKSIRVFFFLIRSTKVCIKKVRIIYNKISRDTYPISCCLYPKIPFPHEISIHWIMYIEVKFLLQYFRIRIKLFSLTLTVIILISHKSSKVQPAK